MPEELKDKIDARETAEERRQRYDDTRRQLDEKYSQFCSDLQQAENLGDFARLEQEWPWK